MTLNQIKQLRQKLASMTLLANEVDNILRGVSLELTKGKPNPKKLPAVERGIRSEGWDGQYVLVDDITLAGIALGDTRHSQDDEVYTVRGGQAPHKVSSQGRVYVSPKGGLMERTYYASVIGAKWLRADQFDGKI